MLECSCRFEGLGNLGAVSEWESLNNAIVKASMRGGVWYKLANDWQDRVVEERNWKMAIPPLWSSLMEEFWASYTRLYQAEPNKTGLVSPGVIIPSGIQGALRDLWAPTVDSAKQVTAQATKAVEELKAAATAKVNAALKAAGKKLAEGAAEETKDTTVNWGAWVAGIAVVGAMGYWAFRKKLPRGSGMSIGPLYVPLR